MTSPSVPTAFDSRRLGRLFWEFFRISLFVVGGGYAILAVADRVFSGKLKWLDDGELMDRLPVLQMVPGLIAGNTAIYVGHKIAGRTGAAVALTAVALPPFAVFLAVSCGLASLPLDNPWVDSALLGARAALTGILLGTTVKAWKRGVVGLYGAFAVWAAAFSILLFHVNTALVLLVAMAFGVALKVRTKRVASIGVIPLVFLKYGLLCFGGGFVLVPMYMDEFVGPAAPLLQLGHEEFSHVIALTQMTPGPVSVNAATFFGYRLGGFAGAALATVCLLLPSYFLLVWALRSLEKWRNNRVVNGVLYGVRPATVGLLVVATYAFARLSVVNEPGTGDVVNLLGLALSAASAFAFLRTRVAPMALIFACAAVAAILGGLAQFV